MYSRTLDKVPVFLLEDTKQEKKSFFGKRYKPLFGSYIGTPKSLGINGIRFPYGIIPLPTFITNLRIRSNFTFMFSADDYIGTIDIIDIKIAGFYEMNIWNKKTNLRYSYRGITGIHRHFVPKNLEKAVCCTRKRSRYIRIVWDKNKNRFALVFRMKGDSVNPSFNGSFVSSYDEKSPAFTSVLPFPTTRRCYVSYQRKFEAESKIFIFKSKRSRKLEKNLLPDIYSDTALCLLISVRAYFKFRNVASFSAGLGNANFTESGKKCDIVFRFTNISNLPENSDEYNENVLFCNNKITPLPSVRITHEMGFSKKWVIQDTEGMVDLVFTPLSTRQKFISSIIFAAQYNFVFGTYEGTIFTKDGNAINIKDFPGICKDMRTRL